MSIKTTLNLKFSQASLLYSIAKKFDVSLSFVINSLARKIFKSHSFSVNFIQCVQYQPVLIDENDFWKCVPVSFEGDIYEKCLDLRKACKLSVSHVFALGIDKYINQVIQELEGVKDSDNYSANYFMFYKKLGDFCQITLLWDMMEEEKLQKLQQLHIQT